MTLHSPRPWHPGRYSPCSRWAGEGLGGSRVSVPNLSVLPALSSQPPAALAMLSRTQCLDQGGYLLGTSCQYVPDVTLFSFLLFGGTFLSCTVLKRFKSSRYFPVGVSIPSPTQQTRGAPGAAPHPGQPRPSLLHLQVRKVVSDFAIILAILASCAVDAVLGLETPKLLVPSELKVLAGWAQRCWGVGLSPMVAVLLCCICPSHHQVQP